MDKESEKGFAQLCYYSERGMVNAICYSICQYKSAGFHFIKKIKNIDGNLMFKDLSLSNIDSIQVFNEFSFGQFGDPDLILKINCKKEVSKDENKSILIFIEAKVGTYENSARVDCESESLEGNASRINFQLCLKKRFVDALFAARDKAKKENKEVEEIEEENKKNNDNTRKLKKKYLVEYINKFIFDNVSKNKIYYVAMTNDNKNPLKGQKLPNNIGKEYLGYITYDSFYDNKGTYSPKKNTRKECVLYGNTYDMFKTAFNLATNNEEANKARDEIIKAEKEGKEIDSLNTYDETE